MIALDPGTADDLHAAGSVAGGASGSEALPRAQPGERAPASDALPFALPGSGSSEQSAQSGPGEAPSFDDDADGTLDPHEDGGQAGTDPDQGPAVGPAADSDE